MQLPMTVYNEQASPEEWAAFCSAAQNLGSSICYSASFELAEVHSPTRTCNTIFDFTQPAPVFTALDDANECVARLWAECAKRLSNLQLIAEKPKNSRNSSKPPSSDSLADRANRKSKHRPSGKKQGGQPGHEGHFRKLYPSSEVDDIVACRPPANCPCCNTLLYDAMKCGRRQVSYLFQKYLTVTEYQIYKAYCSHCRRYYRGKLPPDVPTGAFGACVYGAIALLTGRYQLSKDSAKDCLFDLYGLKISVGSVSNAEETIGNALAAPTDEVLEALKLAKAVNCDETGFYRCHGTTWLWAVANDQYVYYSIQEHRSQKEAKRLLGSCEERKVITDRYGSYSFIPSKNHQYCWSHLNRDITSYCESDHQESAAIGDRLEEARRAIFAEVRQALGVPLEERKTYKGPIVREMKRFRAALRDGVALEATKVAGFCKNLLKGWKSLWVFLIDPLVSPTNNHAERVIRPLVMYCKRSNGTQSHRGDRYVERANTASMTCRIQKRDYRQFVTDSVAAWQRKVRAPSLIIDTS